MLKVGDKVEFRICPSKFGWQICGERDRDVVAEVVAFDDDDIPIANHDGAAYMICPDGKVYYRGLAW